MPFRRHQRLLDLVGTLGSFLQGVRFDSGEIPERWFEVLRGLLDEMTRCDAELILWLASIREKTAEHS